MRDADNASERGNPREAARRFDDAAGVARLARDRDAARHAAARMLARAGETDEAIGRLDAIAAESPPGPEAASAFYDAASLRLLHGDAARGWTAMEAMIHRFPGDGDARPALHRWLAHMDDEGGPARTLEWLRANQPELDRTERAEETAYEVALRLERLRDPHARAAFLAVAERWPYPGGALWDDALFHASAVAEADGLPLEAAHDLARMLAARERAIVVGSAERGRYAPAQLHLGELYRRLGDHAKARATFHALFTEFPESNLRDRGLFEEALLLQEDGDVAAACERLGQLVREIPGSRYVPCALERCPTLHARPAGAPATCHGYLEASR